MYFYRYLIFRIIRYQINLNIYYICIMKTASIYSLLLSACIAILGGCGKKEEEPEPDLFTVKVENFLLTDSDWQWYALYGFNDGSSMIASYYTLYNDRVLPALTQKVLDEGGVLAYFTPVSSDTATWIPLDARLYSMKGYYINYAHQISPGKVRLHYFWTDGASQAPAGNQLRDFYMPNLRFKIVLINRPINIRVTENSLPSMDELKAMSYEEVARILNLE